MLHSCRIKFGAVTNLTDARYAAAAYAEWVGFCFDKNNPRYIQPAKAKEIIDWLSGPVMVAEIGDMMPEEFMPAMELMLIDTVQVHTAKAALAWEEAGFQVIWEGANPPDFAVAYICRPEDATGKKKEIVDLSHSSLKEIKEQWSETSPLAIQVIGGDESAPGIRDFKELDELLEFFEL